ncbi:MAG: cupin domain-containing protein [Kineosporiaceae bacterium]
MSVARSASPTRHGQVFRNDVTGERAVILTDPLVHPKGLLVAHLTVRRGGRVALEHVHPTLRERFLVLDGTLAVSRNGVTSVLGRGEGSEVPPGARHDWWHTGAGETDVLVEVSPGARFVEMLTSLWGLVQDGRTGGRPLPGLLQMAVTGSEYGDVMVPVSPPPWAQRLVGATLGPVGRLLGKRPSYAEYSRSDTVVDPDPAALALLTADGALDWQQARTA